MRQKLVAGGDAQGGRIPSRRSDRARSRLRDRDERAGDGERHPPPAPGQVAAALVRHEAIEVAIYQERRPLLHPYAQGGRRSSARPELRFPAVDGDVLGFAATIERSRRLEDDGEGSSTIRRGFTRRSIIHGPTRRGGCGMR